MKSPGAMTLGLFLARLPSGHLAMGWGLLSGQALDAGRRLAVCAVALKVLPISLGQLGVPLDDDEVLGVFMLGLIGEIEAARDDSAVVDNHHFVMGDGVFGVDERDEVLFQEDAQIGVRFLFVALIEQD